LTQRLTQPNLLRVAQPDEKHDAEHVFGEAVRSTRQARQWTQDQLRRRLLDGYGIDLSKTAMARLELGQRPIRLNEVHAISNLLGIDLSGFGRPPADEELADQALRVARDRQKAVQDEIAVTSNELAQVDLQRDQLQDKLDRLRRVARQFDFVMAELIRNQGDVEAARKVIDEILLRELEA
jgi:transcriptional regulator with XRE-family HTH domain